MVKEKAQRTIRIRWVRSGIGFSYRVKGWIRSLGLRRLNQVVARPDSPQIRGLVAKMPHLVEIVGESPMSTLASVPEYRIVPPEAVPASPPTPALAEVAPEPKMHATPAKVLEPEPKPAAQHEVKRPADEVRTVTKTVAPKRAAKAAAARGPKAVKRGESKKQGKAATSKGTKPSKKEKK